MFILILLFIILGIALGVIMGLIPGLHPNTIIFLLPILFVIDISPIPLLAMIVAMAVTNSIVDFIPSILLGAPDAGNELSVLPGHRLLMQGQGYHAIKLTVIGGMGAMIFIALILPLIIITIPPVYDILRPLIHILLIGVVVAMVFMEKGTQKRIFAILCFFLAGIIGILSTELPMNNTLLLFPMLSGLFGMSILLIQIKQKTKIPEQSKEEEVVSKRTINRSIIFGSLGGIVAGFLPGVGTSQIAVFSTLDRNDKAFLVNVGAITTANIVLSFLTIWLIGRARSGVAIVVDQLLTIDFSTFILIVVVALIACGVASILTISMSKKMLSVMRNINYSKLSLSVLVFLNILIFWFTGFLGLFLAWVCCFLGLFSNFVGVMRSNLMGILILPTILFYIGIL